MQFHVVVNPAGASGWTGKIWKKLEPVFQASHQQYTVHYSSLTHGIEAIVKELTASEEQVNLIIVGGDGTMNAAVNGIRDISLVHLGYIPAGSGNDLARGLKLGKDREAIARTILNGQVVRSVDVGETICHTQSERIQSISHEKDHSVIQEDYVRRFNVFSGMGFDAEICEQADESLHAKKVFNLLLVGKLIYGFECIKLIFNYKPVHYRISYDGKPAVSVDRVLFSLCMLWPYEGGGFKFCPDADGSDGKFATMTAAGLKTGQVVTLMPAVNFGIHLHNPKCTFASVKTAEIYSDRMVWIHTDGEVYCKSDHISLRILPVQLQLLM